jgi:iron complex transport system substrate-binding protein
MIIPEPERLLTVHSDALFIHKQQSEVLRRLGMPGLVEVNFMPRDARKSRAAIWQLIGKATAQGPRVMQLMRWDTQQRVELQSLLAAAPRDRGPRVLLVHAGKDMWSVPGGYYSMGSNIEEAGGINLAANFKLTGRVNLEQILALDPDIMLLDPNVMMSPYASSHDTTPGDIYNMPECRALRAVREHRVYELPQHPYTNESIEDTLLLSWMAEVFYPAQMPHRLRGLYRDAYREIYGYAISEDETDQAIFFKENLGSSGYERFSREAGR